MFEGAPEFPEFYVYEHWRSDTNLPFYVGKGKGKRAFCLEQRNYKHRKISSGLKKLGLAVEVKILYENLTEERAFSLEVGLIAFWRLCGLELANLSNGGDGSAGFLVSEETRSKLSVAGKGRKFSEEHKAGISKALKGKPKSERHRASLREAQKTAPRPPRSPEARVRMRAAQKKRVLPPEVWEKIKKAVSKAQKGRVPSWESRKKMSVSQIGRLHSEETKQKMRLKALEREAAKRASAQNLGAFCL